MEIHLSNRALECLNYSSHGSSKRTPIISLLAKLLVCFPSFPLPTPFNTWVDVACAVLSHGVNAEDRRVSGSSVAQTVQKRLLCSAVTSCERVIKASAALNQI